jgi:hypothetical protein
MNKHKIEETFRFSFSEKTKSTIGTYWKVSTENIKSLFNMQKYEEALFHYKNLALFDKIFSNSMDDDSEDSN